MESQRVANNENALSSPPVTGCDVMIHDPFVSVDVGGTHTKIRLTDPNDGESVVDVAHRVDNRGDMLALLGDTLATNSAGQPAFCVLSAAGPVEDNKSVRMTNWSRQRRIRLKDLARVGLAPQRAMIVNDMVVSAMGIVAHNVARGGPHNWARHLSGSTAHTQGGNMVVIMPGTGLGVAGVVHTGTDPALGYHVVPCELQHAPIGSISARQEEVAQRMRERLGIERPSWEHFACGPGLARVHQMLSDASEPQLDAPTIAQRAVNDEDDLCREALALFYLCAGGIAQLTALSFLPRGGVYLSGRSSKLNAPFIEHSAFVAEMTNNDTHGDLLAHYPVYLVTEDTNLDGGIYLARNAWARL